ncbi:uncharacterized protein LOC133178689 [Saccostrea echinata]|uniref:uncharacterized protein LOC133178689 n=1 Tax=Saccostrea echinata TaxID=191078 RepID=UPI002A813B78|nr:uncharacterized protein LOC133178689 [Saccostrea echinata]
MEIQMLPKKSEKRGMLFLELINEGNYKHNIEVLKNGGLFITARRESPDSSNHSPDEYLPCEFCKGFFLKNLLWHHAKSCKLASVKNEDDDEDEKLGKSFVRKGRTLLYGSLFDENESNIMHLLERMNDGEEKEIIKKDLIIKNFASIQVQALGEERIQKKNDMHRVSSNCRTLARLVIMASKDILLPSLNKLLSPDHFDKIVKYANELSSEVPSLGPKLGHLIGHCVMVKNGYAVRKNDETMLDASKNFKHLFDSEWGFRVNAPARKRKRVANLNNPSKIPSTSDLVKFRDFLIFEMKESEQILESNEDQLHVAWNRLAKATMCRLILFNKRRVAEVEDLPVEYFQKRPKWTSTEEFEESLTDMEKNFAKRMDLVEGFGKSKKNMKAYILLTPDSKRALEVLTRLRSAVGVSPTNKYMFARLNSNTPLSGTTAMKELLGKCEGLKHPENITSTSLRKYIATVSQILDMTQGELKLLAKHLGHDVKTHKEYYQLSSSVLELSKVARMLYAVENGQVNEWAGKKMKDIQLEGNYFVKNFFHAFLSLFTKGNSSENNLLGWIPIFCMGEGRYGELPEPSSKDGDLDYELAGKEDQSSSTVAQASSSTEAQASSSKVAQAFSSKADQASSSKVDQASSFKADQASSSTVDQASSSTVDLASSSTADKPSCSDHEQPSNSDSEQPQYIRSKGCKRRWTDKEEEELMEAFGIQIKKKMNVSTKAIRYAQSKYKTLRSRSEAVIRSKMNNIILGKVQKKR